MFGGMGQNGVVFLVLQLRCEQGFLFYYFWNLGEIKRILTSDNTQNQGHLGPIIILMNNDPKMVETRHII